MNKIKIMTDSASDIPTDQELLLDIKILGFPITIGDKGYIERVDFTNEEFYQILLNTPKIPATSQITQIQFDEVYTEISKQGYDELIYVSINGVGSNTLNQAIMAKEKFIRKNPDSNFKIHIIDSKMYTIAYGYAVMEAAKKAKKGATSIEIIAYLDDWFDTVEIYFAPYTLEFVKKSGRLSCAAAFVGELIGLRPIISIINGETKVIEKVRGDKAIIPALLKYAKEKGVPETPYIIVQGMLKDEALDLDTQAKKVMGYDSVGIYNAGAAITINTGPKIIAIVVKGEHHTKQSGDLSTETKFYLE